MIWELESEKGNACALPSLQAVQKLSLDFIKTERLQLDNKEFSTCGEGCPNRWCQISRDTG